MRIAIDTMAGARSLLLLVDLAVVFVVVWLPLARAANVRKGAGSPIGHNPDFRSVVGLDNGEEYAVMVNSKCLETSSSATIPTLETARTVYEAIALTKGPKSVRQLQMTVMNHTRCVFADYIPRWYEQTSLPYPGTYVVHPPPNQTSVCSLLEMMEVYGHAEALQVPFGPALEETMADFVARMNEFVQEWSDELVDCLQDRVDGISPNTGQPQYTFRTYLYSENFPGVLNGPFSSQFWNLPYLLHQGPRRVDAMMYVEEPKSDWGNMPNFVRAQTRPQFQRPMSTKLSSCNSFAFQASSVHSDALMAGSETLLDLFLTSNLIRYDCSPFYLKEDQSRRFVPQGDFVTCSGCMAFYKLFYGASDYAMHQAFTAKKLFNRIRPEQFAHRIALFLQDENDDETLSCLTMSPSQCTEAGISAEICEMAMAGEPFDAQSLAEAFPFLDSLLRSEGAQAVLNHVRSKQNGCLLLRMLYPEGSPSHDSFPGGHSVFAGAIVSILSMMFCMYEDDAICLQRNRRQWDESQPPPLKLWSAIDFYQNGERGDPSGVTGLSTKSLEVLFGSEVPYYLVDDMQGIPNVFVWEGTEDGKGYRPSPETPHGGNMTVWGEMVKYASQYTHARDRAGVHYYSDGCAGLWLGQISAIRYMIEELRRRPRSELSGEEELVVFPLLDGRHVVLHKRGFRFWGQPRARFRNRVNDLVLSSPMNCGGSLEPVKLRQGLAKNQHIPEQVAKSRDLFQRRRRR